MLTTSSFLKKLPNNLLKSIVLDPFLPMIVLAYFTLPIWYAVILFIGGVAVEILMGRNLKNLSEEEESLFLEGDANDQITVDCFRFCVLSIVTGVIVLYFLQGESYLVHLGFALVIGLFIGAGHIIQGHEMAHKVDPISQRVSALTLATVGYVTFKVEHVRGHHVWVSTPKDPSTSRLNESLYLFLLRAIPQNIFNGFKLEAERLRSNDLPVIHWQNEVLVWSLFTLLLGSLSFIAFGLHGLIYYAVFCFTAIFTLETINYVEHYGLQRKLLDNGRYERVSPRHSWNASERFSSFALMNVNRHSDHHAYPTRPYPLLRHFDESPQLPFGYYTMYVIALFPPLWFKIMNPLVANIESESVELAL